MNAGQSKLAMLGVAIILLVLLAYQPMWHAGFIWDDVKYAVENEALRPREVLSAVLAFASSRDVFQFPPAISTP